tara:strand:- start:758 stop:1828 length:1071 start_codon:yes stop_codon:yes gene_type:complete
MKSIEIQNLDQHLRPLQVAGVSTGLELSTEALRISSGDLQIKNITSETAKVDGDLTVDGNIEMSSSSSTKINMYGDVYLEATTTDDYLTIGAKNILLAAGTNYTNSNAGLYLSADSGYDSHISFMEAASTIWSIGNDGAESTNTLSFSTGAVLGTNEKMSLDSDGLLTVAGDIVAGDDIAVASTGKINFDGIGGDTYVYEHSADHLRLVVGGDNLLRIYEQGDDGNQFNFVDASIGFTQVEPSYDATTTAVDFRFSNKQNLTFGAGNITNITLTFPAMSGNFQLLLKQDGTGSRTVTNWKVMESDESSADGDPAVKWAGGSAPTLTTAANHVDILSFYWDADNEIAYGVATLDFQD